METRNREATPPRRWRRRRSFLLILTFFIIFFCVITLLILLSLYLYIYTHILWGCIYLIWVLLSSYGYASMEKQRQRLPVYKYRTSILYLVESHSTSIIVGETGSGKTTQIPQVPPLSISPSLVYIHNVYGVLPPSVSQKESHLPISL